MVYAHNETVEYRKVYVDVTAEFSREGGVRPLSLIWKDGREFAVERVSSYGRMPARVGGLLPVRYTCIIAGKERWLYFESEKMRWFVEAIQ